MVASAEGVPVPVTFRGTGGDRPPLLDEHHDDEAILRAWLPKRYVSGA